MANEQSKAAKRRINIGAFHSNYFAGHGIDIGGKPDPLGQYAGIFSRMMSARTWDIEDGDAQFLESISDEQFDFLHSSHCLEHLVDPHEGLRNWIRVVKKGGYLTISIPDEDLYELGHWPSQFNSDHKWTFTICKSSSWSPKSINVLDLIKSVSDLVSVEKIELINQFFREPLREKGLDQTMTPVAECCIEMVLKKL